MRASPTSADAVFAQLGLPDSPVIFDVRDERNRPDSRESFRAHC